MQKMTGFFIVLSIGFLCVASASAVFEYQASSSSVPEGQQVQAGQEVEAYTFVTFHTDFDVSQIAHYTTDLENASWNYSVYIVNVPTLYPDWYPRPSVTGKNLTVYGFNNGTDYIDGIKATVQGTVPAGKAGSDINLMTLVLVENASGKMIGSPLKLNSTLASGNYIPPVSPTVPTSAVPATQPVTIPMTELPSPTATKSPLDPMMCIGAIAAAGAVCIGMRMRQE